MAPLPTSASGEWTCRARALPAAIAVCALLGIASLVVPCGLGYDPWAWLVWGRELLHVDLHTTGGPSWKPLPVILTAPLTLLGGVAPWLWVAIARAAGFAALFLAYRLAARLTGSRLAGCTAALGLALSADFFVTALRGYSEPLLIALVLAAVDQHLAGRRTVTAVLLALAGLLRPEVWPFAAAYGAFCILRGRARPPVRSAVLVAAAPVVWLLLDLWSSGDALRAGEVASTAPPGSAARSAIPALTVLGRVGDAVIAPVLALALAGAALAGRRVWRSKDVRFDRALLALAGLAAAWTAIVAVMAEIGFTGRRRYLAVAAALLCVCAGVTAADLLGRLRSIPTRRVAGATLALAIAAFGFSPARTDYRLIGLAGEQRDQLEELSSAVERAGGRERVRELGGATVNPFVQTALAWKLGERLDRVQATWTPSKWSAPTVLFRAPSPLAGPRPELPRGTRPRPLARVGRWRVSDVPG